ncbi:hypothetical protein [Nostoc sp. CALU 1950]|uniref:hypothetical protein n=1 Tax=Nostoc sp. CALU 1950 TaxID=3104321 RepID=UPI003EBE600E
MENSALTLIRSVLAASVITTSLTFSFTAPSLAQAHTTVRFSAGNDNTFMRSSITGNHYHDYVLNARAGQRMSVSLITKGSAYFNILPPGSTQAIYNSSISGNDGSVRLPQSGNYTVRVYLKGGNKDRNRTIPFELSVGIL